MRNVSKFLVVALLAGFWFVQSTPPVEALILDTTIDGSDAIFLAGRTDVVIPAASDPWTTGTQLIRHGGPTPEKIQETLPPIFSVSGGDIIRVLVP